VKRPKFMHAMQPIVFFGSAGSVVAFIIFGTLYAELAGTIFSNAQTYIARTFGWFYVLTASSYVAFTIWIMFSRFGRIRLGGEEATPEFGRLTWFAMLFSAGMGTGLVFWGVAEPVMHYMNPPTGEGGTQEALREAMRYAFFHWGLHPWAIYIVLGLSVAYFHFRHELPLAPRSVLYPLIGERIHGPIGHAVDILATVGTLLGVATSLGLGAMQINRGIAEAMGVAENVTIQVAIIAVITAVATISVVLGVRGGIRRLSQFNLVLALAIFTFVLIAGPTLYLLETWVTSTGLYLQNFAFMSLWVDPNPEAEWQMNWTLFYWGWWISWSPFVGIFVARVSRGRTIREFVISVLLVPTFLTLLWLSVFGGTGLYIEAHGAGGIGEAVQENVALSLHAMLAELPLSAITSVLATLLVVVFFITSSDSGSLVDDMVTSGGHPHPPRAQRVFWAVSEGSVAAVLLLAGGLQALQSASISAGLPMNVLLLATSISLLKALRRDAQVSGIPSKKRLRR